MTEEGLTTKNDLTMVGLLRARKIQFHRKKNVKLKTRETKRLIVSPRTGGGKRKNHVFVGTN